MLPYVILALLYRLLGSSQFFSFEHISCVSSNKHPHMHAQFVLFNISVLCVVQSGCLSEFIHLQPAPSNSGGFILASGTMNLTCKSRDIYSLKAPAYLITDICLKCLQMIVHFLYLIINLQMNTNCRGNSIDVSEL